MAMIKTLQAGKQYLQTWPLEPKLGMIFPENRIIRTTKFAQQGMPLLAVFAVCWWYFNGSGLQAMMAMLMTVIVALLLPLQGLYWLGKRASSPLSPQSAVWFYKIFEQLQQAKVAVATPQEPPTYQDLANLLSKAKQHLPADFWQAL